MTTVSDLVSDVAEVTREPRETVNAYARALIEGGLLPKSSGRAIAHVTPRHVARLFLAIALAPKIKDTADTVATYGALVAGGIPESAPASIERTTAEDWLCGMLCAIKQDNDDAADRAQHRDTEVEIILNWPEIIVTAPEAGDYGEFCQHFTAPGSPATLWRGHVKRSYTIHGRTFAVLGGEMAGKYFVDQKAEQ